MKMNKTLTAAMIIGTLSLSAGMAASYDLPTRGPIPFVTWDADGDGTIEAAEFNTIREQRQEMVKAGGFVGRNMASAPTFSQIDKDNDGKITAEELTAMQRLQYDKSTGGYHGAGQAMVQGQPYNRRGMGRGRHVAAGQRMVGNMGQRYQAMDTETKEKYDAFIEATTELRKEIAVKRAEKQAVMRSTNPDPTQAAQLTGDLFELRRQMMAQVEEAGVEMAQGRGNGRGHGGRGYGGAHW